MLSCLDRSRVAIDDAIFSFDDNMHMRRYAFEALIVHSLWLAIIFVFTDGAQLPFLTWLEGFYQWDARWYGTIANDGHGFLAQTYVFPPFYGWLLGRLTDVLHFVSNGVGLKLNWPEALYLTAFLFGTTMFAFANTLFVFFSERRWNLARPRLWAIAVSNPVGYFALIAYSDMFFFVLMLLAMLLILWTSPRRELWKLPELSKQKRWAIEAGLVSLLIMTPWVRLTGFAFAAWALLKRREVLATFLSLGAFLLYYWIRTDNPFFFLLAQQVFQMPEGGFIEGLSTSLGIIGHLIRGDIPETTDVRLYTLNFGILPIFCLATSLGFTAWLLRRREFEWALIVMAITAISHNQAFWRSTVRYTMPFFPFFYWMLIAPRMQARPERVSKAKTFALQALLGIAIGLSLMLQLFYGRLFRSGGWAF